MNYWVYRILCFLTHPFRALLMPNYRHEYFAIRLLFRNSYKTLFVTLQAHLESGHFKSNNYKSNNNVFSIGKSVNSKYQDGSNKLNNAGEPTMAVYKSIYRAIYDYYDLVTNRKPNYAKQGIDQVPVESFEVVGSVTEDYLYHCANIFKGLGYYTSGADHYGFALSRMRVSYKNSAWRFGVNWLLSIAVPGTCTALAVVGLGSASNKKKRR